MDPSKETTESLLLRRTGLMNLKSKSFESPLMSFNLTKAIERIEKELIKRGVTFKPKDEQV